MYCKQVFGKPKITIHRKTSTWQPSSPRWSADFVCSQGDPHSLTRGYCKSIDKTLNQIQNTNKILRKDENLTVSTSTMQCQRDLTMLQLLCNIRSESLKFYTGSVQKYRQVPQSKPKHNRNQNQMHQLKNGDQHNAMTKNLNTTTTVAQYHDPKQYLQRTVLHWVNYVSE